MGTRERDWGSGRQIFWGQERGMGEVVGKFIGDKREGWGKW